MSILLHAVFGIFELTIICIILAFVLEFIDRALNKLWIKWSTFISNKIRDSDSKEKEHWKNQLIQHDRD